MMLRVQFRRPAVKPGHLSTLRMHKCSQNPLVCHRQKFIPPIGWLTLYSNVSAIFHRLLHLSHIHFLNKPYPFPIKPYPLIKRCAS
ncbi:hypothetical protein GDO78_010705 [Eleutherodactylus coqui]|uniref:Uncharacterized protein n=1 Tax=Eleutherodactylus coqui TaxID=57060 RepID=A0A8J6K5I5_ELECQ|nr:hypothetical protein GDO78_010705 [Eleutherodactylus coqui]